jgi:lysophospholipase L1-like esterase
VSTRATVLKVVQKKGVAAPKFVHWRLGATALMLISCGSGSAAREGTGGGRVVLSSGGAVGSGGRSGSGGAVGAGGSTGPGGATSGGGGGDLVNPGSGGAATGGLSGGAGEGGGAGGGNRGGAAGDATAPGVRVVGRTAPGTMGGMRIEWSGTSFSARFMGTQASAQLNDGNNGNSFEVVIDGGSPRKLFTMPGQATLALATGLANGVHELLMWRDTEANVGPTEFIGLTGFGVGGALLPPPPAPDRRIELVGDSFSCGAGIEGLPGCPGPGSRIENHYLSYGAIAARAVGADLVTIAWSGIGVWRNFGATAPSPSTVMPARYDYAIPTDTSTTWDFSKYQPHVVIMNLNNNDFSTGDPGQPYIDAYLNLTRHIRSKYPDARFIHVIEWRTANTTDQSAQLAVNRMVTTLRAGGDMKHDVFDMRPYANLNQCGGHPDIAAAQAMGAALAAELRTVLAW